jgi:hypothetical protein
VFDKDTTVLRHIQLEKYKTLNITNRREKVEEYIPRFKDSKIKHIVERHFSPKIMQTRDLVKRQNRTAQSTKRRYISVRPTIIKTKSELEIFKI